MMPNHESWQGLTFMGFYQSRSPVLEKAECVPSFLLKLPLLLLFAIDWARAADEVPEFDIARNCKAETSSASSIEGPAHCTSDETEAKNQIAKRWSSYSASQKKQCVGETVIGGDRNYVELLTCLEIAQDPNR